MAGTSSPVSWSPPSKSMSAFEKPRSVATGSMSFLPAFFGFFSFRSSSVVVIVYLRVFFLFQALRT